MTKTAITGAYSYTGRYVARLLLEKGHRISNLTNHSERPWKIDSPLIENHKLIFQKQHLIQALRGCQYLLQTYWVRFDNTLNMTRQQVSANSKMLIDCAKQVGIKKIIYTSHTKTSINSPFEYIRQKANIQKYIKESGIAYGIIKPCGIFGRTASESILINNICYLIRKFPLFPLPSDGAYKFQMVHVQDMADLIVQSIYSNKNQEIDAVGPEKPSFKELIVKVANILNTYCVPVTGVNQRLAHLLTLPLNWYFDDILIDKNDLGIMSSGLTFSDGQPTGKKNLFKWVEENKEQLGKIWISSKQRYYK